MGTGAGLGDIGQGRDIGLSAYTHLNVQLGEDHVPEPAHSAYHDPTRKLPTSDHTVCLTGKDEQSRGDCRFTSGRDGAQLVRIPDGGDGGILSCIA